VRGSPAAGERARVVRVGLVPISDFIDRAILPQLSDWVVETGSTTFDAPTQSEEGFVRGEFAAEFNVPHGNITGIVPVVYAFDGNDEWRIISGADAESPIPDSGAILELRGNSRVEGTLEFEIDVLLPEVVPGDPSTEIQAVGTLFIRVGPEEREVPPDPTMAGFGVPGS